MVQISDYADVFIYVPCYLGYLCAADKFFKKYLGAPAYCGQVVFDALYFFYDIIPSIFYRIGVIAVSGRILEKNFFCFSADGSYGVCTGLFRILFVMFCPVFTAYSKKDPRAFFK